MTYLFKLARRGARLRAFLAPAAILAFAGCNTDQLTSSSAEALSNPPIESSGVAAVPTGASFAAARFRGGIPFGTSGQPTAAFGEVLNGAHRNIYPKHLRAELEEIRSRGGKVELTFSGNEENFKDRSGHFDLGKWKARVDRFKDVDISSYIADGTVIGHYLIDEPYDPANWAGKPVPSSVVEEMAKYSKQRWPNLPTIVRARPSELKWNGKFRYLDAAWAQYSYRKGNVEDFIRTNVADAQAMGLGLVVGLNLLDGSPTKGEMNGEQVESWGSVLLSSSYPCAFISWQYNARLLGRDDVKTAMARLAEKASARPSRSCSGSPTTSEPPTTLPSVGGFGLKAVRGMHENHRAIILTWSGARGANVDMYKNGKFERTMPNDGRAVSISKPGKYSYRLCEAGKSRCSNTVSARI